MSKTKEHICFEKILSEIKSIEFCLARFEKIEIISTIWILYHIFNKRYVNIESILSYRLLRVKEDMRKKDINIKVININKPTKKEAERRIKQLSEYLSQNWKTPLEK